jgi:hypothetical protein
MNKGIEFKKKSLKKTSSADILFFKWMIAPLAPTLPPWGAGVHDDAPALPELKISWRFAFR